MIQEVIRERAAALSSPNNEDPNNEDPNNEDPNNEDPNDKKDIFFKRWNASFKKNYPKLHKFAKNTTKFVILPGALIGGGVGFGRSWANSQNSARQNAEE